MKGDELYVRHILDSIKRIQDYTPAGRTCFMSNPMAQDAVVRNLEIIGEAPKRLTLALRSEHSEIP